jgi:hypothetical protein
LAASHDEKNILAEFYRYEKVDYILDGYFHLPVLILSRAKNFENFFYFNIMNAKNKQKLSIALLWMLRTKALKSETRREHHWGKVKLSESKSCNIDIFFHSFLTFFEA